MSVQVIHGVLAAAGPVTALVGDRIEPLERKEYTMPAAVLSQIGLDPVNALDGWAGLDSNLVQVDAWASTYAGALTLAQACRTAIEAAGHLMQPNSPDAFDPLAQLGGVYRVSYQYLVWT